MLPPIVTREEVPAGAVLVDVRLYLDGRSALDAYRAGHLPGAVHVDLERWLAAPASREAGRHPLPDPETFAEGLARAGIGDRDTVVAYDDAGGVMAARLVWLLRAIGHPAALLDGGLDGPLETGDVERPRATFTPRPWPAERLADLDAVAAPPRGTVVLDARDGERFRGEVEPIDAQAGHIPGARSLPTRGHLGDDGRHRPAGELRERFAAAGVGEGTPVVAYCGSGVTACHQLLVLEHAGLGPGRLFPGSWSQYSATGRPVATGS